MLHEPPSWIKGMGKEMEEGVGTREKKGGGKNGRGKGGKIIKILSLTDVPFVNIPLHFQSVATIHCKILMS